MKTRPGLSVVRAIPLFLLALLFLAVSGAAATERVDQERVLKSCGKLPLYFIENRGQLDPEARFYVKTSGQTLYFTDEGIVFDLLRREKEIGEDAEGAENASQAPRAKAERLVFNLRLENARKGVLIEGLDRQEARLNYFVGNDRAKWKRGIPTYKGVVYREIYKGIDLKVFGNGREIEYEFIVNPGGNPNDILLTYNGIEGLSTNGDGELLIATAFGKLKETRPHIYQEIEGEKVVDGGFEIRVAAGSSQACKFSYGFRVASYDPSLALIIDPTLSYSTYLGGNSNDYGYGIVVDGSGSVYVAGSTYSTDFPTQNPYQGANAGSSDVFITKFSLSGNALSYSTFLGGSLPETFESGPAIAVDGSGNAYVTGVTFSSDFPTQNPYQGANAGYSDVFITKLSPTGSALIYSTYLGGSHLEIGRGIAVEGSGSAYVTGDTFSSDFPTQNPYQEANAGDIDVFITKLSPSGTALSYSTYLGGSGIDSGYGIVVDGSGSAYVTGNTGSSDFPTQNPYQGANAGGYDAFITKLSPTGSALIYSTYLGGSDWEIGGGIAVEGSGSAYVAGITGSSDFPTQNPYQGANAGGSDVFITKLSPTGSALSYSTYLGGSRLDYGKGIAVDGLGNAYVTGSTDSSDFPTQNPYQGANAGGYDAFITKLSPTGTALSYSTYLGGSDYDRGIGIAVDGSVSVYVTGNTWSTAFPTQKPYQGSSAGSSDAFVTKLAQLTVTTQAVTEISTTTATGNGNIINLGAPNPTQHGVCWNTSGNPTIGDSKTEEGAASATGPFTSSMTGLSSNTIYYVRAYATNTAGTAYGGQVSFNTNAPAPTVTTQAVTEIGMTTATGNGNIINLGSPNPTQHGVCWNTNGNPTTADSKTEEGATTATGAFTTSMTGLSPNTTYYVRAYATNTNGTAYGNQVSFKALGTLPVGSPSSYKVIITKIEMWKLTAWITIFSGTAQLDVKAGGAFPGTSDLDLPAGTYTQVRVTFNNAFPVTGTLSYEGTAYYTTATTFGGQINLASTPTTVAGDMAAYTFYNPAWGALNADVTQTFPITAITVGPSTDYQPTLRFTISNTLHLKGTPGDPSSYYFSLDAPTVTLIEP